MPTGIYASCHCHDDEKDIMKAQKWLQRSGSKIKVTGKITIGMATAICAYQRKNSLPVTGELDEITWTTLKKENRFWRRIFHR